MTRGSKSWNGAQQNHHCAAQPDRFCSASISCFSISTWTWRKTHHKSFDIYVKRASLSNTEAVANMKWFSPSLYLAMIVCPAAQVFLRLNVTFGAQRLHSGVGRDHICHLTLHADERQPAGGNLLIRGQLQLTRKRLRLVRSWHGWTCKITE